MSDLYEIEPIKEVIYEPYLKIPRKLNEGSPYQREFCYHTNVKLPKDEYVIEKILREYNTCNPRDGYEYYECLLITNYGRLINTNPVIHDNWPHSKEWKENCSKQEDIVQLEKLPYKIPKCFWNMYIHMSITRGLYPTNGSFNNDNSRVHAMRMGLIEDSNRVTKSIQELNKEFQLLIEKTQLEDRIKELEIKNAELEAEVKYLKTLPQGLLETLGYKKI
jgi:hypothetical protein